MKRNVTFIVIALLLTTPIEGICHSKSNYVEFKHQPTHPYSRHDANAKGEDIYNPDLSTGDDDVAHHPDMNIDL